jgi:nucleoside-diphosphate-sugar epimerase
MTRRTAVITGITSFLGFHLGRAFSDAGYYVIGTYHRPPERMEPLRRARFEMLKPRLAASVPLDVTDALAIRDLVSAYRPVLWVQQAGVGQNFAANDYDLSAANRINLDSLDALFPAIAECGGALLATGSGMEYGAVDCPYSEEAACWPQSPYGLAKLTATLWARQLAYRYRVPTRVARVFTVFGEMDGMDRIVTRLFARLRAGERIGVAPGVARDVCDVADLARGYLSLAADCARGPLFDIFNLSRGTATPLSDLARMAARVTGANPELVFENPSALRSGEPALICGDSRKALSRLGWAPRAIEDGLMRLATESGFARTPDSPARELSRLSSDRSL